MTKRYDNDQKILQWQKDITMTKRYYNDENILQWPNDITMTKRYYNDKNILQWLKEKNTTVLQEEFEDTKGAII